ncbi:unnamed protein product [Cyprideis torosa]|uniref:Uncharacterized protein n=1 Tax=Cyprideis torosa TaxID=163714 RepID=A0A7R8W521_9CRUS|nr:unnamed protein product [Cyprideis torosa]CAG0884817.1 unnamed protein product [Cyprideis torosa]
MSNSIPSSKVSPESEENEGGKTWVKFEDESSGNSNSVAKTREYAGAVIDAAPEVVVVNRSPAQPTANSTLGSPRSPGSPRETDLTAIDLSATEQETPIRTRAANSFNNGDVIVTLLPLNTKWAWISPALFKPHLVPEELMAQGLTLTVEDYVHAMELLVNDYRFTLYNILYKRILVAWMTIAFTILLGLLFSGAVGLTLFGFGILWLILNATALFVCMWIKVKLNRNLERCMTGVNKVLYKHKILLGLDDRGRLSCHKVNLCFIYMDPQPCIKRLNSVLASEENRDGRREDERLALERTMDLQSEEVVITGNLRTNHPRKLDKGECLFLRYSQRWSKEFLRKRLDWMVDLGERISVPASIARPNAPLHVATSQCPCQFVEDHIRFKPKRAEGQGCCSNVCRGLLEGGAFD